HRLRPHQAAVAVVATAAGTAAASLMRVRSAVSARTDQTSCPNPQEAPCHDHEKTFWRMA
ncbi:MAG: hypothetical protein ACKO1R_11125, partial [Crocinitomicaceae bacterium]